MSETASDLEPSSFADRFRELFDAHFARLFRYIDRATGDPDLAADLAQEAFVKLYRRGSMPDSATAWLISVALNLLRNARNTESRRRRLLSVDRERHGHGEPAAAPDRAVEAEQTRVRVRAALDGLTPRDRDMLLLSAEGYSYREIADAMNLNERSVGKLLARAKQAFEREYREVHHES